MNILTWTVAFLAGFLASLGTGGGMLLIIWLTAVMGTDQLDAQGINLLFFIPISLVSVIIHSGNRLAHVKTMLPAMAAGTVSAVIGSAAAHYLGSEYLRKIYAVFILVIGIRTLIKAWKSRKDTVDKPCR